MALVLNPDIGLSMEELLARLDIMYLEALYNPCTTLYGIPLWVNPSPRQKLLQETEAALQDTLKEINKYAAHRRT